MWTKQPYGGRVNPDTGNWEYEKGRWRISNGHLRFDVHLLVSGGSGEYIVSPEQADEYASKIVMALNDQRVILNERMEVKEL